MLVLTLHILVQGLHPSVREARKSVARELVCLQEKLDSLCKQLPSEKEEPERTDDAIQTTAHVVTAEASEEVSSISFHTVC